MANIAKLMKHDMLDQFKTDKFLNGLYKEFKEKLISTINEKKFIDLYAQTIVYGLFAARINQEENFIDEDFNKENLREFLPKSNPFLEGLFNLILDKNKGNTIITGYITDLIILYSKADLLSILNAYKNKSEYNDNDPIVYFYEDFLEQYDKKQKKDLGVWYTPKPVVNFIIRAIDDILQNDFKINYGLLNNDKIKVKNTDNSIIEKPKIQILDPATGTGTFLAELVQYMYDKIKEEGQEGMWDVKNNIIPRLNAFEIIMVSYAIAHLKLEMKFKETGYNINQGERLNIYLTDSLENPKKQAENNIFAQWIPDEVNQANIIKNNTPIMIVLGNPPYKRDSKNNGNWIKDLIDVYKKEPNSNYNVKLNVRKHNLDDDYVKFIRLGENFIEKNENGGILAYISNNSFLDGLSFRGMRWKLLETFDKIYILNLHGKKEEKTPNNTDDINVFYIEKVGVSINIFIKNKNNTKGKLADVFYCDLYGKREEKFNFLDSNNLQDIKWQKIEYFSDYSSKYCFFTPKNFNQEKEYEAGFAIDGLFDKKSSGIKTERNEFTIHFNETELRNTIEKFLNVKDDEEARAIFNLGSDGRDWKVRTARKDLEQNFPNKGKGKFIKIQYKPFDLRTTFYTGVGQGFHQEPRYKIMQHILNSNGNNIGLCLSRNFSQNIYQHIIITEHIVDINALPGNAFLFPLYIYEEDGSRTPNIKDKTIIKKIESKTGLKFTSEKEGENSTFAPIDLLDYIYAVLYCPNYREKYIEFLKIEFPKIPYPKNKEEFNNLINIGSKLRKLHLFKDDVLNDIKIKITYPMKGNHKIEKIDYVNNKLFINEEQYFDNISEDVWNFNIGSFPPISSWLNNRKGRILSTDEREYLQKMIKVIYQTINIMNNELSEIKF